MREFFQGWRRKAGLATLAMACLSMACWMRSNFVCDQIHIQLSQTYHLMESHRGRVTWERGDHIGDRFVKWESGDSGITGPTQTGYIEYWSPFEWRWKWGGVVFGVNTYDVDMYGRYSIVPYWSFVLPLTLLSAWLLLIKPRPAKSAKESSRA